MAPISDDRDRIFEKALARHFRAEVHPEGSVASRSCADIETLAAYHEGELAPEQMNLWKTHVKDCPRCQGILAQLEATDAIPFGVADNVEKQKNAGLQVLKPRRPALWRWAAPAGALAAGLLVWVAVRESKPVQIAEVRKDAAAERADKVRRDRCRRRSPTEARTEPFRKSSGSSIKAACGEWCTNFGKFGEWLLRDSSEIRCWRQSGGRSKRVQRKSGC